MKTKILSAIIAMAASAAFAQTNTVLSKNAVGYVRLDVPAAGQFLLVGSPFNPLNPTNGPGTRTLQDILPDGSGVQKNNLSAQADQIYLWDYANAIYQIYAMKANGQYYNVNGFSTNPPANPSIPLGDGFWLKSRSGITSNHTVYVMGEVPSGSSVTNQMLPSFQFRSNPYPVASDLDLLITTNMGAKAANLSAQADQVYLWETSQVYTILALKLSTNRWWPANNFTTNAYPQVIIQPGQAFWFKKFGTTNTFSWVVSKPYTWP